MYWISSLLTVSMLRLAQPMIPLSRFYAIESLPASSVLSLFSFPVFRLLHYPFVQNHPLFALSYLGVFMMPR